MTVFASMTVEVRSAANDNLQVPNDLLREYLGEPLRYVRTFRLREYLCFVKFPVESTFVCSDALGLGTECSSTCPFVLFCDCALLNDVNYYARGVAGITRRRQPLLI